MIPNLAKPNIEFDIQNKVLIVENVISSALCDNIVEFGASNVQKGINKYANSFQVSFHACLLPIDHEIHTALENEWNKASIMLDIPINFIEPYELKRYTTDDFFGKHGDSYFNLKANIDRKLTMSIQLSDESEYEGGMLSILGVKGSRKKGSVTIFPSYFPHEVFKISSGTRWSLIGWAWGPNWR